MLDFWFCADALTFTSRGRDALTPCIHKPNLYPYKSNFWGSTLFHNFVWTPKIWSEVPVWVFNRTQDHPYVTSGGLFWDHFWSVDYLSSPKTKKFSKVHSIGAFCAPLLLTSQCCRNFCPLCRDAWKTIFLLWLGESWWDQQHGLLGQACLRSHQMSFFSRCSLFNPCSKQGNIVQIPTEHFSDQLLLVFCGGVSRASGNTLHTLITRESWLIPISKFPRSSCPPSALLVLAARDRGT